MQRTYSSGIVLFSTFLCLAGQSLAQAAPRDELRRLQGWSATEIIGTRVRGSDGSEVGKIEDLVLSTDDRVVTAVVSVGGLLGIADKLVAVQYADLRLWSDDRTLAIPLTKAELEVVPGYKARPPSVGDARPLVDAERAAPPDAATRREANEEAQRVFAADDPRVAEGIAENKKAYEDEKGQEENNRSEQ
jgi:sporulation protein YlmC with PRC-barrel domain